MEPPRRFIVLKNNFLCFYWISFKSFRCFDHRSQRLVFTISALKSPKIAFSVAKHFPVEHHKNEIRSAASPGTIQTNESTLHVFSTLGVEIPCRHAVCLPVVMFVLEKLLLDP